MLVSSPYSAATFSPPAFSPPSVGAAHPAAPSAAAPEESMPCSMDDDDEALQAVLLASLQSMQEDAVVEETVENAQQKAEFERAVQPPLVAMPSSLKDFAEEAGLAEDVKSALAVLEAAPHHLKLVRVRGDGHCLYRVVGAALILGAAWAGREVIDALIAHLEQHAVHPSAREVAALVVAALRRARDEPAAAFAGLAEATESDALVMALRRCAVGFMQASADRFRHCGDGEGDWESYCTSQRETSRYGGHPELVALSESLQIRIDIFDTSALSLTAAPSYRLGESLPAAAPVVRGLRRGLHYSLLLPATPEGCELSLD